MQEIKRNDKMNNEKLLLILAGLILARFSCVALSNIPFMTITFVLIYVISFIVLFFLSIKTVTEMEAKALAALIIYALEVVLITVPNSGLFNTQAFNAYIMVALFVLYLFTKRLDNKGKKLLFTVCLIGYVFTFAYSIIVLIQNPMLSRYAATGKYSDSAEDSLNAIGGFDTVYGALLVFAILLYLLPKVRKGKVKTAVIFSLVACIVFIVMATYATALVLMSVIAVVILLRKSKKWASVIICVLLFALLFRGIIGDFIMGLSKDVGYSVVFKEKLYQIGYILKTGESVGTLAGSEGRWARIGWSLEAFLQYPIFGAYGVDGVKIGFHSEIADTLGRFGLVGFVALATFFYYSFNDIYCLVKTRRTKKCITVCVNAYVLIAILDPALYTQQLIPIFLLLPTMETLFNGENKDEKTTLSSSL